MKRKSDPARLYLRILGWGFLACIVLGLVFEPTCTVIRKKWEIERAVAHAKTITIVHYNPYIHAPSPKHPEIIYGTKELLPDDFHKVNDAFPLCLDVSFLNLLGGQLKCVFDPHHRIVITDNSGNQTAIQICFLCDHYAIAAGPELNGDIQVTPFIWQQTLRKFFTDEGLPFQPERYTHDYIK